MRAANTIKTSPKPKSCIISKHIKNNFEMKNILKFSILIFSGSSLLINCNNNSPEPNQNISKIEEVSEKQIPNEDSMLDENLDKENIE